jgi:hypothetical protein
MLEGKQPKKLKKKKKSWWAVKKKILANIIKTLL